MKGGHDLIPVHLRLLSNSGDLLREVYAGREFTPAPDQQRQINSLTNARALVETGTGEYRIARHLKRYLDSVLRRNRSYAVGDDLRAQIGVLEKLAAAVERAAAAGQAQEREDAADEFAEVAFEISQDVDVTLSHLRALVDSRFADVASHGEKRAQNEYYLDRLEGIEDTMALIADAPVQERLEATPFLDEQHRVYRRDLRRRLPLWRSEFLNIAAILREHIHSLRRVEPKARMLRRLAFHLDRNRGWTMPDAPEDAAIMPDWAKRSAPIAFAPSPDIGNGGQDVQLRIVAQSIPPSADRTSRERRRGTLVDAGLDQEEVEISPPAWRLAIDAMIAQAAIAPLRADDWRLQHAIDMPRDLWLFATLDLVDEDTPGVIARALTISDSTMSGNLWLTEVELCPRS